MSALSIATIAMFTGLGLVALALVLLGRRTTLPALVIGLSGLLPLTASAAWLVRAWPVSGNQVIDNQGPRAELLPPERPNTLAREPDVQRPTVEAPSDKRSSEAIGADMEGDALGAVRRELSDLKAEAARKDADLQAERQRLAEANSRLQALQRRAEEQERLATEQQRRAVDLAAQLKQIDSERATTAAKPGEPAPPPSAVQERPREDDVAYLQNLIGKRIETPHYSAEPLGHRELVAGYNGHWYVVRLRLNGQPLIFPDRQFRIPAGDALTKSMGQLLHDILGPVARLADEQRVFVRGGADSRRVTGPTDAPGTTELMVLPRSTDSTWAAQPEVRRLTGVIGNEDLPALRAEWLRSQISPLLPAAKTPAAVAIMANPPGLDQGRTAEILLYVKWRHP